MVRLQTTVPEEVNKEFRHVIAELDLGFKKDSLKKHTTRAIRDYILKIKQGKQQQQHTAHNMQLSKEDDAIATLTDLMKQIVSSLWNDPVNQIDASCGNNISERVLRNRISSVRNIRDGRTVKKWFERLVEYDFIQKASNQQYRILNDGHDSFDIKTEQKKQQEKQVKKEFDSVIEASK